VEKLNKEAALSRKLPVTGFDYVTSKIELLDDIEQEALVVTYHVGATGSVHYIGKKWYLYDDLDARRYNHNRYR